MFLIIDDLERYKKIKSDFAEEESIHFVKQSTATEEKEVENYINQHHIKALFVHLSYRVNDNILLSDITRNYCLKKQIPYVEFSGGTGSNLISDYYAKVEVNQFYEHFRPFYEYYQEHQVINLSILIYGKNYLIEPIVVLYENIKKRFAESSKPINKESLIRFINENINASELEEEKNQIIQFIRNREEIDKYELLYSIERWIIKHI